MFGTLVRFGRQMYCICCTRQCSAREGDLNIYCEGTYVQFQPLLAIGE